MVNQAAVLERASEGNCNGKRLQAFRAISVCHNLGRGLKGSGQSQRDTDYFNKTNCLSAGGNGSIHIG